MKRTFLFLLAFTSFAVAVPAAPTPTPGPKRTSNKPAPQETIAQSANGWSYVKGEWIHPAGYKFVNRKILRTTARPGGLIPKPPGKLALDNAQLLAPKTGPAPASTLTEAERKAAERRKNLTPTPPKQTGTHM